MRQFLKIYVNELQTLNAMRPPGDLYPPIRAYADEIETDIEGLTGAPQLMIDVARMVRETDDALEFGRSDRFHTRSADPMKVGGHAQLEALGTIFQIGGASIARF